MFRSDGPVVVDWQTAMRSFPGVDLGWLLMSSHNGETLAREPELLDHYRRELAAAGGPDWSAEDLAEDLAWAGFYWVGVSHVPFMHSVHGWRAGPRPPPLQGHDAGHPRRRRALEHRRAHEGP